MVEKEKRKARFEAYLLVRKTQLMLQYCLSVCQNLNLICKRVEGVCYGLSKMKICHSGWLRFLRLGHEKKKEAEIEGEKNREKDGKRSKGEPEF